MENNYGIAMMPIIEAKLENITSDDLIRPSKENDIYINIVVAANGREINFLLLKAMLMKKASELGVEEEAEHKLYDQWSSLGPRNYDGKLIILRCIENERRYSEQVSVLSIDCGNGKSRAIRRLIVQNVTKVNPEGILIITDNVNRLDEYITQPKGSDYDTDMYETIKEHQSSICLLKRSKEKYGNTIYNKISKASVLLITTQRFFQTPKSEIFQRFIKWKCGQRKLVIFDEQPYIKQTFTLTREIINDVESAMLDHCAYSQNGLEERIRHRECFKYFKNKVFEYLEKLDDSTEEEIQTILTVSKLGIDDRSLLDALKYIEEKYKNTSKSDEELKLRENLRIIRQFIDKGGLCSVNKSSSYYNVSIEVYCDNSEIIQSMGVDEPSDRPKVIIMDGTASVGADYFNLDGEPKSWMRMDQSTTTKYSRELSFLNVHIVNCKTSGGDLKGSSGDDRKKTIRKYIVKQTKRYLENEPGISPVVFSYDGVEIVRTTEKSDETDIKFKTDHFNNIKGRNDWNNSGLIFQVGLNRVPDKIINSRILAEKDTESLEGLSCDEQSSEISRILEGSKERLTIQARIVVADIIQNIFRGRIRNADNIFQMDYYLLTSFSDPLFEKIYELLGKYLTDRNAHIQIIEEEELLIQDRERREDYIESEIIKWLRAQPVGKQFAKGNIEIKKTNSHENYNSKYINDRINKNHNLSQLFEKIRKSPTGTKYVIPENIEDTLRENELL